MYQKLHRKTFKNNNSNTNNNFVEIYPRTDVALRMLLCVQMLLIVQLNVHSQTKK